MYFNIGKLFSEVTCYSYDFNH